MKLRRLLFGLAATVAIASCQDPIEVVPSLEVTPETLSAKAEGETLSFTVKANMAWTASAEGLTLNPSSGEGSDNAVTVSVTVPENTATEAKTYTIAVSVDDTDLSKTVTVNQAAAEPEPEPEYELDGKQWKLEVDGFATLLDFGLLEEGFLAIALPTMDYSGFALHMVGSYEIVKTDNTSGIIAFEAYDCWETNEFYDEFEISYSELGETTVKISCENIFGYSDFFEASLVENPYDIEFDNGEDGPEGEVTNGNYWFIVPDLNKVMTPLAEDETSGFLAAEDAVDGASTAANAFTLKYDPDWSCFTIQDSHGRYLCSDTEDPFRKICVSETLPADNDELKPLYMWVVFDLEDGTFDVYNYSTYYSISYNPDGDYFETYDYTLDDFINLYPSLVPAE